jgi:hypothetical protein
MKKAWISGQKTDQRKEIIYRLVISVAIKSLVLHRRIERNYLNFTPKKGANYLHFGVCRKA